MKVRLAQRTSGRRTVRTVAAGFAALALTIGCVTTHDRAERARGRTATAPAHPSASNREDVVTAAAGDPWREAGKDERYANAGHAARDERDRGYDDREEESEEEEAEWRREREEWLRMQRVDDNGEIPLDGIVRAAEHAAAMDGGRDDAGLRLAWEWLGPGNIGGRTRAIVVHPTIPSRMMMAGVTGGIWRTFNSGARWEPVNDFLATLTASTVIIDPNDPDKIYVGTGESFAGTAANGGGAWVGNGIFRTLNAWDPNGATFVQMPGSNNPNFIGVNRLAHHPSNVGQLFAATTTGLFISNDIGFSWNPVPGWPGGGALDVKVQVRGGNPNVFDILVGTNGGVFLSDDGGQNFRQMAVPGPGNLVGRCEVAFAPSSNTTIYVSANVFVPNPTPPPAFVANGGEIWRGTITSAPGSGNPVVNWTLRNTGTGYLGNQGGYDNALWVDPTNANRLIVGGIDLWGSNDGGATLTQISDWRDYPDPGDSAHADQHVIIHHPGYNGTSNRRVYVGNDGGVFRHDDIIDAINNGNQNDWLELNNNLGVTQFYKGAAGPRFFGFDFRGFELLGGTQDNRTLNLNINEPAWGGWNPDAWYQWTTGDGGYCAIHPVTSGFMYEESQWMQITRSGNFGQSYSLATNGLADAQNNGAANQQSLFIAPFEMDPNSGSTLVAGGLSVWRTTDSASNWSAVRAPVGRNNVFVSALAVTPGNSARIWAGYSDGEIALSRGNFPNLAWDRVDLNPPMPGRFVTEIHPHRTNPNVVFVSVGGFSNLGLNTNVWRGDVVPGPGGTNAVNWTLINGAAPASLPDLPVYTVTSHPDNPSWLYVGTDLGVFASEDAGQTWSTTPASGGNGNEGPANVIVMDLFWLPSAVDIPHPPQLVAATHGRGMFRVPVLDTVYVDLANSSGTETGTSQWPFDTFAEGYNAAGNGSRMIIRTGAYDETALMTKRLRSVTAESGAVVIGE